MTLDRLFTNVMGKPQLPDGAPQPVLNKIEQCLQNRPSETLPPSAPSEDVRHARERP
jgi:hypothetical protein